MDTNEIENEKKNENINENINEIVNGNNNEVVIENANGNINVNTNEVINDNKNEVLNDNKNENIKQEKEVINSTKKENDILIKEMFSFFFTIIEWSKICWEIFGEVCLFFGQIKEKDPEIRKQNEKYEKEYIREMNELESRRREIIREKKESIRKIHINKTNKINEINQKYNQIISYLETIKNDKDKIIELLNKKNLF